MCYTTIYKGWISIHSPGIGVAETVLVTPGKFFYRPKNHVIAEKITRDVYLYGSYVNMSIWTYTRKAKPNKHTLAVSFMGPIRANYYEMYSGYTQQYVRVGSGDILEHLTLYHKHYCVIEITYHKNEYDMISHEMELILLLNRSY